jgi:hypothetical protein
MRRHRIGPVPRLPPRELLTGQALAGGDTVLAQHVCRGQRRCGRDRGHRPGWLHPSRDRDRRLPPNRRTIMVKDPIGLASCSNSHQRRGSARSGQSQQTRGGRPKSYTNPPGTTSCGKGGRHDTSSVRRPVSGRDGEVVTAIDAPGRALSVCRRTCVPQRLTLALAQASDPAKRGDPGWLPQRRDPGPAARLLLRSRRPGSPPLTTPPAGKET